MAHRHPRHRRGGSGLPYLEPQDVGIDETPKQKDTPELKTVHTANLATIAVEPPPKKEKQPKIKQRPDPDAISRRLNELKNDIRGR